MKKLVCEMCGSTELIKEEGFLYVNLVAVSTLLRKPKR